MHMGLLSPDELAVELGRRIRAERLRRGWAHHTLVDRSGVSRSTVVRMERGESVALSNFLAVLVALGRSNDLAQVLQPPEAKTIDDFVGATEPPRQRGRR
jgi:transcriptional regulator with XRE-family HTH domain